MVIQVKDSRLYFFSFANEAHSNLILSKTGQDIGKRLFHAFPYGRRACNFENVTARHLIASFHS
jgi:hypothetical protein